MECTVWTLSFLHVCVRPQGFLLSRSGYCSYMDVELDKNTGLDSTILYRANEGMCLTNHSTTRCYFTSASSHHTVAKSNTNPQIKTLII